MSESPARLASVDALRGISVGAMLLVNNPGDWGAVYGPLLHAPWHGFTATDLIFPLFLFIVGVSIALAPAKSDGQIAIRALRIVVLGLALHALAHWLLATPNFRPWGVLQRIGICYGAAALLTAHTQARTQWIVFCALLLGYWALLAAGGPFEKGSNLADRVDTALLGRFGYQFDPKTGLGHEPEGLLSTLPAIATTILGVRAGDWLRERNARALFYAAVVALLIGWLWAHVFPINKSLWTSSYVLWSGGWCFLLLAATHLAIDRARWPAIGRRLGMNAIAVYAGAWVMSCVLDGFAIKAGVVRMLSTTITPSLGAPAASLAYAVIFVSVWWAIAAVLDRRRVYIKI